MCVDFSTLTSDSRESKILLAAKITKTMEK